MTETRYDFVFREGGIADQIQAQIDAARLEGRAAGETRLRKAAHRAFDKLDMGIGVTPDELMWMRAGASTVVMVIDALEGQHD